MKLHHGPIPIDPNFDPPAQGWKGIWKPGPESMQVFALPVAILTGVVLLAALYILLPGLTRSFHGELRIVSLTGDDPIDWLGLGIEFLRLLFFVALILLLIFLHEVLHALLMPGYGKGEKTLIAIWPEKMLFYASYSGAMPRDQYLWVFVSPLILLTILPIGIVYLLEYFPSATEVQTWLIILALVNGISACGDILGFTLVLFQVPKGALVRSYGWKTYWKKES